MEEQVVYLCGNTLEGIFTAVYDAWAAGIPTERLSIQCKDDYIPRFFDAVTEVDTDFEKAIKVTRSIKGKLGWRVYEMVYYAVLSYEEDKADAIYRFLKLGFQVGAKVADMHGEATVCRMFDLQRNVKNESHMFREFLRFHETPKGVLVARIKPKNQVLPYLAEHFSDRFPGENFVILDEVHHTAVFHEKEKPWFLSRMSEEAERLWSTREDAGYEKLWKLFFHTIAIEDRKNPECQRNMCAYRYRDFMVEFH